MNKLALALFFLFSPLICGAQTWSTLPVDALVSMNTSTPGTTLTAAIANAGTVSSQCTVGTQCTWNGSPGPPQGSAFTVGANRGVLTNLGPVQMTGTGGALFPAYSLNYNNIAHNDSNNTNSFFAMSGGTGTSATSTSILFGITIGQPYISNGDDWDIAGIWLSTGQYYEVQLNNFCNASGQFGVRIENGHPTTHSPTCVSLLPQHSYFMSLSANFTAGTSTLNVYTVNGSLVGSTTATTTDTGGTLYYIQIGNNENGSNAGTFTYFQNLMVNWTTAPNPYFWTNTALSAPVVAPGRATNWSTAGVTGGVPNRTTVCSSLTSAATTAQINSAIAACPAGDVVSLAAGTYSNVTAGPCFGGVSNVTLRGAGANQTFLAPTSGSSCGGGSIGMTASGSIAGGVVGGVSGFTGQGSGTLTLATGATTLLVGNPIMLDQLDPTCDNGGIFESGTGSSYTCTATSPGLGGPYNSDGGANGVLGSGCSSLSPASCYHQQQFAIVSSCNGNATVGAACSGSNVVIVFSPGLQMPNWTAAKMRLWWYTNPIQGDSVEDLSLNSGGNSGANGIQITGCQGCWVKGVSSQNTAEAHIQLLHSSNVTIENNYLFLTQGSTVISYGVECFSCGNSLVVNNIMHALTTPMITNGPGIGNVFAYNFTINDVYTSSTNYSIPNRGDHASASQLNLTEGNIGDGAIADAVHGTANMESFFRNYYAVQPACWTGGATYVTFTYGACNSGITEMQINAFHRFFNLVGNVLGTSGVLTNYCNNAANCYGTPTATNNNVLGLGYGSGNDPNTVGTMMLWGNADSATGFTSPRFNCAAGGFVSPSEVSTFPAYGTTTSGVVVSQFDFHNSCPASNTLPASFVYSSKPSWWPSAKPFPIIGPDVTSGNLLVCTGGTQTRSLVTNSSQCPGGTTSTAAAGLAYSNPAMDCYLSLGGNANGTGGQLTGFNETSCYSSVAVPVASFSPTSLAFGNQTTGTTSAARLITLTNTGNASLIISGISLTGSNPTDFAQTNNCGATVLAGGSCAINVTFTPASAASFSASVSVADNAAGSPQTVALTGTGVTATAAISFAPTSLAFGNQQVAVASSPLSTTVTNTGSATLTVTAVTITGTNPSDFTQTNTCGSVAPTKTCSISVTFKPAATGARSASVSVTDNAAGSPQAVPLTGTGTAAAVGLSPASLAFGNQTTGTTSAARTTTLTNTGSATLTISSITITGTNAGDFAQTNNCAASVAVGGSCIISVKFTPSAAGSRTASVSVTDNASGSPQTVPLTGTGVTATSGISFNPTSLAFGNQQAATSSAPLNVIATNTGSATLTFTGISITGTNASYFSQTNNCSSVAPAGTCTISVTFTPAVAGSFSANVSVADNVAGSPQTIALTGTGTAAAVSLSPSSINFSVDSYGGQLNISCTALGYFHTQKVGNHWYLCDPIGHGFVAMSVGSTPNGNPTPDCAGNNTFPIYNAKYGDTNYNWAWQTLKRMTAWGFNSIGQDSVGELYGDATCSGCVWPGGKQPIPLPYILEVRPGSYAAVNEFGYLTEPIKDLLSGTNPTYWNTYRGGALFDVFDPKLNTEMQSELASSRAGSVSIRTNDPYLFAVFTDDSDWFDGTGGGPDFATAGTANLGFTALLTSPVHTFIKLGSYNVVPYVYQDQVVHTKAQATNPVTICSVTNPCSLRDYLWQKYGGSISALNTSWGSSYTTFDSSGTQVTNETVGTGDGTTTTFTHTLAHSPVSVFSVMFSVAGVPEGGDCPWFYTYFTGCVNTVANSGTFGSVTANYITQSTSTINYSTGAITINFVTAPASGAAITMNYVYGGWMAGGTGLMDEDGANTTWVGTNAWCLEGASASYPTYFSCTGGGGNFHPVPNANANLGADLDNWIPEWAGQYFGTMHNDIKAVSKLPYFGLDNLGTDGGPAYSKLLQGAAPYLDGAFVTDLGQYQTTTQAEFLNRYQYQTQYLGDLPFMTFNILSAQNDSSESCHTGPVYIPNPNINFATQALRGTAWENMVSALLTTPSFSGTYPLVGFNWWAFQDFQGINQGLDSLNDNAYDAVESVVPAVTCDPYYTSATTCGGENATYNAPYGNAISSVTAGNLLSLGTSGQPVGTPSAPRTVTLTNTGSAVLTISSIAIGGVDPGDFSQTNNCGSSVAVKGSCTINVVFTPTAVGTRLGNVTVTDNAVGSPQLVALTGIGYTPTAAIAINPTSLTFATQTVGTPSNAQAVIVTNTGTATITFSSISITGTNAGDYGQTNTCGSSLTAGNSCAILVTFMPTAAGSRTASVSIADNVAGSPQTVALSGTGIVGPLVAPDPGIFSLLR